MNYKPILTLLLACITQMLSAQTKFTDQLQQIVPGKGRVVLHQSQAITDLVNSPDATPVNSRAARVIQNEAKKQPADVAAAAKVEEETEETTTTPTARVRMNGYRIQVYSGGNSRQAKNEATMMGNRVKSLFSELSVYTNFASPHWICRVGDFKTYEEANEVFRQLRATGRFREAVIVKSKILAPY